MGNSYSIELRELATENYTSGMPKDEIIKIFSIGIDTPDRWTGLYKNTGSVEFKKKTNRRKRKTGDKDLVEFIEKNPSSTLKETADHFSVCHQAIHRRFKLLGITYKKKLFCTKK